MIIITLMTFFILLSLFLSMDVHRSLVCHADHEKYSGATRLLQQQPGTELGCADSSKRWEPGRTLKVHFMDGSSFLRSKVQEYATQWTLDVNVPKFDWNDANTAVGSEIRISFSYKLGESWSHLGNYALTIPKDQPTMNFGWLKDDTDQQEIKRVVLHEFGHALGLVHEHQHPKAKIPFKEAALIALELGWPVEQVQHNIIDQYDTMTTQFSAVDLQSIMMYAFPASWTTDGTDVRIRSDSVREDLTSARPLGTRCFQQWTSNSFESFIHSDTISSKSDLFRRYTCFRGQQNLLNGRKTCHDACCIKRML